MRSTCLLSTYDIKANRLWLGIKLADTYDLFENGPEWAWLLLCGILILYNAYVEVHSKISLMPRNRIEVMEKEFNLRIDKKSDQAILGM